MEQYLVRKSYIQINISSEIHGKCMLKISNASNLLEEMTSSQ